MDETYTVTHEGSPRSVSALAQMLETEGVSTSYKPPMEERGVPWGADANAVVVNILAVGTGVAIKKAIDNFRARFPQAKVTYQPRHAEQGEEGER